MSLSQYVDDVPHADTPSANHNENRCGGYDEKQ